MLDYELFAFVGPVRTLAGWASQAAWARAAVLRQGLALIPLAPEGDLDALIAWGLSRSQQGPIALLRAECFGGTGREQAWSMKDGALTEHGGVSDALLALRVRVEADEDPRVAAGLLAHPTTLDWMAHVAVDRYLDPGPSARKVPPLQGLIAALTDPDLRVRVQAAERLGRMGRVARPALPALQAAMRADPRDDVVLACGCAMGRIGAEGIPMLHGALDLPDSSWALIYALGEAGPEARAAAPTLRRRLRDDASPRVRAACAEVLGRVAVDESADALVSALSDADRHVRVRAAEALGRGFDLYRPHLEALQVAAADPDPYVRGAALDALHRLDLRFQSV